MTANQKFMPNKPTTLRESLLKEFDQLFVEAKNHRGGRFVREEAEKLESFIVSAIDKFLTSHNTELVQKIEGMWNYPCDCERKNIQCIHDFTTMHAVINLINQEK